MRNVLIVCTTMLLSAAAHAEALNLHLVCEGVGDHQVAHSAYGSIFGSRGTANAFGVSHSSEQFAEQMDINIAGSQATARVPRRFLPKLHGGDGGIFEIKDLLVSEDTITGTVLVNFANHPKLHLDRRTGAVSLDGKVGAYSGQCRRYDSAEQPKAF
jgi:hypothetical protein